jgi:predicted exporter
VNERRRTIAFALLTAIMGVYCALHLRVGSDITRFLPMGSDSDLAALSSRLADSPLTRTLVISLEADELSTAIAAARELSDALRPHPEVAWIRSGLDETDIEQVFELYFPHRLGFLSDDPERELPDRLTESALRERARALRLRLASPASGLFEALAARDPLGSFEALLGRMRADQPALRNEAGQLVTNDGRFAIVLLGTKHSAFDTGTQGPLLAELSRHFEEIAMRRGGGLELELASVGAFAMAAETAIKADVYLIAAFSFIGVALLFTAFVQSLRGFLVATVPPLSGILTATTVGLLVFGELDGMTMVFGASLMGIVIDYSNHVLLHHGLAATAVSPQRIALRLRPSLLLGALTTVASFVGLGLTPFPAFRQMAAFAITGVLAGLAVSLWVLPELMQSVPPLPARAANVAKGLDSAFRRLTRLPRLVLLAPIALGLLAAFALPAVQWSDDLSQLTQFDPELVDEDRRVRERVAQLEGGRFVIAIAADSEAALLKNDVIHERLQPIVATGAVGGIRSLHSLVWSETLQRRNYELLREDPELYARLDAAFEQEGFRPGAFSAFGDALAAPPPSPLRIEALQASPLAQMLAPFVFDLGDRTAVVTYLRDLDDPVAVQQALAGLDDVHLLDRRSFISDIYSEFRKTSLRQILLGGGLVLLLLAVRYRAMRPVIAAFVPSVLVTLIVLAVLATIGAPVNLLHVMSLVMVMGIGVDYGIFCVDSARWREDFGATLLSLLLSCLTTAFVFGSLAFSSQPSLRAIGITTGVGVLLSFLLAPVTLAAAGLHPDRENADG